ncbi:MAG: NADH-quinone oxidoreductase subunit NuoE [Phycisphaerae bacterium]|nr:NADH-quinone oxidoreductase subunit NuoE [Phycisphaerae bacterium]
MAWITKHSAAATVPRRPDPYLTAALKQRLSERVLPRFETRLAALLPVLHEVQHEQGWIPPQAMVEIADFLGLKPADVIDTASFYEEYWLKPKGRRLIQVCRSIACEFCGQPAITDAIRAYLGIDVGETTDDGEFTFIELECLGACDLAPVALIDHALHERLTPESACRAIDAARRAGHTH